MGKICQSISRIAVMLAGGLIVLAWCGSYRYCPCAGFIYACSPRPDCRQIWLYPQSGQLILGVEIFSGLAARGYAYDAGGARTGAWSVLGLPDGYRPAIWNDAGSRYPASSIYRCFVLAGCGYWSLSDGYGQDEIDIYIPFWAVGAVYVLLVGGVCLRRRRRIKRAMRNICLKCGYDLRAHRPGQRCPECGTPIPPGKDLKPPQADPPAGPLPPG